MNRVLEDPKVQHILKQATSSLTKSVYESIHHHKEEDKYVYIPLIVETGRFLWNYYQVHEHRKLHLSCCVGLESVLEIQLRSPPYSTKTLCRIRCVCYHDQYWVIISLNNKALKTLHVDHVIYLLGQLNHTHTRWNCIIS